MIFSTFSKNTFTTYLEDFVTKICQRNAFRPKVFTSELFPHLRSLMELPHWKDPYIRTEKKDWSFIWKSYRQILKISNFMDFFETCSLLNSCTISGIKMCLLFHPYNFLFRYGFNSWLEFCVLYIVLELCHLVFMISHGLIMISPQSSVHKNYMMAFS